MAGRLSPVLSFRRSDSHALCKVQLRLCKELQVAFVFVFMSPTTLRVKTVAGRHVAEVSVLWVSVIGCLNDEANMNQMF